MGMIIGAAIGFLVVSLTGQHFNGDAAAIYGGTVTLIGAVIGFIVQAILVLRQP